MWEAENTRGLSFATASDWSEAASAFSAAVESINAADEREPANANANGDALALVLGNLAHACFLDNRVDEAIRHQQRACALRAAILGEDAISVARSRSDLAVMLASSGRIDEAPALIARAITAIEQGAGEHDLRLAVVLENAARTLIAAGQPDEAAPHLVRLRSLLSEHELSTDRADMLLTRVQSGEPREPDAEAMADSQFQAEATSDGLPEREIEEVSIVEQSFEDEPLRDAVMLTDVLLRSTPSGVDAIRMQDRPQEKVQERENRVRDNERDQSADDVFGNIELAAPASADDAAIESPDVSELSLDGIELLGTDEKRGVGVQGEVEHESSAADVNASELGFVVEYGTPLDEERPITDVAPSADLDMTATDSGKMAINDLPVDADAPFVSVSETMPVVDWAPESLRESVPAVDFVRESVPVPVPVPVREPVPVTKSAPVPVTESAPVPVPKSVPAAKPRAQEPEKRRAPRMAPLEQSGSGGGGSKRVAIGAGIAAIVAAASWFLFGG